MEKIIKFIVVIFLVVSCTTQKKENDVYLLLNNDELKHEIIRYAEFTDSIENNKQRIIRVYFSQINDSTEQFVITSDIDASLLEDIPYHFVCKIGEREVFFTAVAGLVRKDWGKRNFFNLKEKTYIEVMKRYFPKEHKEYLEQIERIKRGETYSVLVRNYDPVNCYLTFVYDKLVNREMHIDSSW